MVSSNRPFLRTRWATWSVRTYARELHNLPTFEPARTGTPIEPDRQGMGRIVPAWENACGVWNRLSPLAMEVLTLKQEASGLDPEAVHKEFEPQKIRQAPDHVSWRAPLPQVAGEVMSNLILRHSLPNANHRTGIAMLQFCIET